MEGDALEAALAANDAVEMARVLVARASAVRVLDGEWPARLPLGESREEGFLRWLVEAWRLSREGEHERSLGIVDRLAVERVPETPLVGLVADVYEGRLEGFAREFRSVSTWKSLRRFLARRGHMALARKVADGIADPLWRGFALLEHDEGDPASGALDEVLGLISGLVPPQSEVLRIGAARALIRRRRFAEALAAAEALGPEDGAWAARIFRDVAAEIDDAAGAREILMRAAGKACAHPGALAEVSEALHVAGLQGDADEVFERALRLVAATADHVGLAQVACAMASAGRAQKAAAICALLESEIDEASKELRTATVETLVACGFFGRALELVKRFGVHATASVRSLSASGRRDEAKALALAADPPDYFALAEVARLAATGGDVEGAQEAVRLIDEPGWREVALRHAAIALVARGEIAHAMGMAEGLDRFGARELAVALLESGADQAALVCLTRVTRRALELEAASGLAWLELAAHCNGAEAEARSCVEALYRIRDHVGPAGQVLVSLDTLGLEPAVSLRICVALLESPEATRDEKRQFMLALWRQNPGEGLRRLPDLGGSREQLAFLVYEADRRWQAHVDLEPEILRLLPGVDDEQLALDAWLCLALLRERRAQAEAADAARVEARRRVAGSSSGREKLDRAAASEQVKEDPQEAVRRLARSGRGLKAMAAAREARVPIGALCDVAEECPAVASQAVDEALGLLEVEIDSVAPCWWLARVARALAALGRRPEAVALLRRCLPKWWAQVPPVAFALAHHGAREELKEVLRLAKDYPDTGFALCGALARAWPDAASSIRGVVTG